jgi:putative PIN family toxin of toxin-antitoxin system
VIDANTIISAALNPAGLPRRAIGLARARGTIALSEAVYQEIAGVLTRPKFARVLTEDRRREILELLSAAALWAEPKEKVRDCRDSKDNCYLELALAAGATAIVSGDEDLLVLSPWRGIQVMRSAEFLDMLGRDGSQR